MRTACLTHSSLITGSMPGIAASTSETCCSARRRTPSRRRRTAWTCEVTWAWTSRPITTSQSPVAPLISFDGFALHIHGSLVIPSRCPDALRQGAQTCSMLASCRRAASRDMQRSSARNDRDPERRRCSPAASHRASQPPRRSRRCLATRPAQAQRPAWPQRFVQLVVPFTPGGGIDAIGRIVGARLSEMWGQQVVVENKPGAGGNIASEMVARSDTRRLHDLHHRGRARGEPVPVRRRSPTIRSPTSRR